MLLAATATLLARSEDLEACGLKLVTANRFRPELHHAVGNVAQEVFVAVDVSGDSFADVLRSVWTATLGAHRNGQFRPERARALAEELIRITLLGDTSRMEPARIEGFLRGLERVLLALAEGDLPPAGFPSVAGLNTPGPVPR
ncbi:hypothetical protein AAGT00_32910 [Streptomyces cavourensis]